jgi:hypothetical protein
VRQHLVDDDFQAVAMRFSNQFVKILERAEHRVDRAVIRHVVTHIGHGRFEEGRQPDRVDAERGDVGDAARDAGKIAAAIAGRILERPGIDLIDHAAAPPVRFVHFCHFCSCPKPLPRLFPF